MADPTTLHDDSDGATRAHPAPREAHVEAAAPPAPTVRELLEQITALVARLPHGTYPRLSLGVTDEGLAALVELGAPVERDLIAGRADSLIARRGPIEVVDSATLTQAWGPFWFEVSAQGQGRPATAADLVPAGGDQ